MVFWGRLSRLNWGDRGREGSLKIRKMRRSLLWMIPNRDSFLIVITHQFSKILEKIIGQFLTRVGTQDNDLHPLFETHCGAPFVNNSL